MKHLTKYESFFNQLNEMNTYYKCSICGSRLYRTDGGGTASTAALYWIGAFVVSWLLTKILNTFGYEGSDAAAVGYYDPSKDIRR